MPVLFDRFLTGAALKSGGGLVSCYPSHPLAHTRVRLRVARVVALCACACAPITVAASDPEPGDLTGVERLGSFDGEGEPCLVCGEPISGRLVRLRYRGRTFQIHDGRCLNAWREHPQVLFSQLQPRGFMFDEPMASGPPPSNIWLFFALYVLVGVAFGAACAYVAVGKCRSAVAWFFAGFFTNLLALGVLLVVKPCIDAALPAGVPTGLRKVPTTRLPQPCPDCGQANHPSAAQCPACGATLTPSSRSEAPRR